MTARLARCGMVIDLAPDSARKVRIVSPAFGLLYCAKVHSNGAGLPAESVRHGGYGQPERRLGLRQLALIL